MFWDFKKKAGLPSIFGQHWMRIVFAGDLWTRSRIAILPVPSCLVAFAYDTVH